MTENAVVRARIDQRIKDEAAAVLGAMGLTVSDAFRLLMVRIAKEKALPFEPLVPNAETIEAMKAGLNFIRLATPTTDDKRLPTVLANTSGFIYYVSIAGITGSAAPDPAAVSAAIARIKRHTKLPVCVGFGVRTAEQARAIAKGADGVVVGSALVDAVRKSLGPGDKPTAATVPAVAGLVHELAEGVRSSLV